MDWKFEGQAALMYRIKFVSVYRNSVSIFTSYLQFLPSW